MLKQLRRKGLAKKILWFVAIIIIISFGFLGNASRLSRQGQAKNAGTIFGKSVSFPQFESTYRDVRVQALIRHGDKLNEYLQTANLNAETWDRLILLNEAKRRRMKVSDAELVGMIQQFSFFQRDGQFDDALYQDIVRYVFKVPARSFEEAMRDSLLIHKLFTQETFSATVLDEDILQAFQKQTEKIQVSYVFIPADQFKDAATFNEEAAQQYFEEHKNDFTLPESIDVEYIRIPFPPTPEGTLTADDANSPKKQSETLADTVFEDLKENPDFKTVAEKHQLEAKQSGFFSMEDPKLDLGMSYELLKQLFTMPLNVISQPVESSDAYFIVKIAEKKESAVPEYEEVKDKVKDAILTQQAMVVAQKKAEEILPQLKKEYEAILPPNFANAAKTLGLELSQTPVFNRGQYLPGIGISKDFQEAAFALKPENAISEVVQAAKGYYILHLDQYVPADPKEFEQVKDQIAQFLLQEKRDEIFGEFLSGLRLKANLVDNVSKLDQDQQTPPQ